MPDPTNDRHIEELLDNLDGGYWPEKHAALIALVAERDKAKADFSEAWRERSEFAKRIDEADAALAAANQRIAQLESQQPDRDLRERLLESALQGSGCRLGIMEESDAEELGRQAAWIVNGALAAMRKGEADGK